MTTSGSAATSRIASSDAATHGRALRQQRARDVTPLRIDQHLQVQARVPAWLRQRREVIGVRLHHAADEFAHAGLRRQVGEHPLAALLDVDDMAFQDREHQVPPGPEVVVHGGVVGLARRLGQLPLRRRRDALLDEQPLGRVQDRLPSDGRPAVLAWPSRRGRVRHGHLLSSSQRTHLSTTT